MVVVEGEWDKKATQRVELTRWGVEVVGEMDEKATQRIISTRWVVEEAGVERSPNQEVPKDSLIVVRGVQGLMGVCRGQRDEKPTQRVISTRWVVVGEFAMGGRGWNPPRTCWWVQRLMGWASRGEG